MSTSISHYIAASDRWQKEEASVTFGSRQILDEIQKALKEGRGSLIGRHGSIEITMILLYDQTDTIHAETAMYLEKNAGIFPRTKETILEWIDIYKKATQEANVFAAAWYKELAEAEWRYLGAINPNAKRIPLRSLEPYYSMPTHHWTRALEGHRVTVVSSFVESMKEQLEYRESIWPQCQTILPVSTQWSFVRSYYCPTVAQGVCQWPSGITNWSQAVDYLEAEVLKTEPRIVLLGCGGLAMPLAARLKRHGIVAIVLGGAIQLLFGIKGRRWDNHDFIPTLYNDWIYPSESEIPGAASDIEGGCYW